MSTYSNLYAAAPDDTAKLIFDIGMTVGLEDAGTTSNLFARLGTTYEAMKGPIYAGRVAFENAAGALASKQAAAVAAVRAALP